MNHKDHLVTHVYFGIDKSSSMRRHAGELVKVVDDQIAYMARRSKELGQEWRVSVYLFADDVECIIWDMDVLRLPSIASLYEPNGNTALVLATLQCLEDAKLITQKYGDHSFLTFIFTDGEENRSHMRLNCRPTQVGPMLNAAINAQAENVTVAALVPNITAKKEAQTFGFPRDNISVWDPNADSGVGEAMQEIRAATDSYMVARASGTRGTRTLFSTAADAVNAQTIKAAGLQPLAKGTYDLLTVPRIKPGEGTLNKDKKPVWELASYVTHNGLRFVIGRNYYRLDKQEIVAGDKELAVREKSTNKVFVGDGVRAMIGLSDQKQRVAPDKNPEYDIFVQSKSNNRHLHQGDEILVLK